MKLIHDNGFGGLDSPRGIIVNSTRTTSVAFKQ